MFRRLTGWLKGVPLLEDAARWVWVELILLLAWMTSYSPDEAARNGEALQRLIEAKEVSMFDVGRPWAERDAIKRLTKDRQTEDFIRARKENWKVVEWSQGITVPGMVDSQGRSVKGNEEHRITEVVQTCPTCFAHKGERHKEGCRVRWLMTTEELLHRMWSEVSKKEA